MREKEGKRVGKERKPVSRLTMVSSSENGWSTHSYSLPHGYRSRLRCPSCPSPACGGLSTGTVSIGVSLSSGHGYAALQRQDNEKPIKGHKAEGERVGDCVQMIALNDFLDKNEIDPMFKNGSTWNVRNNRV